MNLHTFLTKLSTMPVFTSFEPLPSGYEERTILGVRLNTFGIHTKSACVVDIQADGTIEDAAAELALEEVMKAADDPLVVRSDRAANVEEIVTSEDWQKSSAT